MSNAAGYGPSQRSSRRESSGVGSMDVSTARRYISSLNEMFTFLPSGDEKLWKNALYNMVTLIFLLMAMCAVVAVYFILSPFLRPLVWALLLGSALHPFKQWLKKITREWLVELNVRKVPVTIGSITLPFATVNWIMEGISRIMIQYFKLLLFIFVVLLSTHIFVYYFTLTHRILTILKSCYNIVTSGMLYLQSSSNTYYITSLAVVHLTSVFFWNDKMKSFLTIISPFIWISVLCQVISFLGTIGVIICCGFWLLVLIGLISSLSDDRTRRTHKRTSSQLNASGEDADQVDHAVESFTTVLRNLFKKIWSWFEFLLPKNHVLSVENPDDSKLNQLIEDEEDGTESDDTQDSIIPDKVESTPVKSPRGMRDRVHAATSPLSPVQFARQAKFAESRVRSMDQKVITSNVYIYALLWSCLLAYIWKNPQILLLLPFPLAFFSLKWLWSQFAFLDVISCAMDVIFSTWFETRRDALVPPIIKTTFHYLRVGDKKLSEFIEKSLDSLCSLTVILIMLFGMLLAAVFLAFQIYGESIHLVNLMSSIVNTTLVNNPELSQMLPEGLYGADMVDELIGNAYLHGRKWLKNAIRGLLNVNNDDASSLNASMAIEKQLLHVWDRSYQLWLNRDNETQSQMVIKSRNLSGVPYNWNMLFAAFKTLDFSTGFHVIKENIDTVLSILESIWVLLKGNLSLFFSALTAIFSLILSGSSALLNGVLNFVSYVLVN